MFPLAVALLILGYSAAYVGWANLNNGSKGPTFTDAINPQMLESAPVSPWDYNKGDGIAKKVGP